MNGTNGSGTIASDALLDDDHELDEPLAATEDDEPIHLAKCADCDRSVRYRASVTGHSFVLVDGDPDAVFGVGEHGRPVCPDGHGEMSVADDRLLPAADAFAAVADMQEATQRSLPGIVPPFNFEGAYLELEAKALEVDRLHRDYKSVAEDARQAKKDWDKAAELYTSMALELRRRRREKDGEPKDATDVQAAIDRVPCTWEAAHAGGKCPLCTGSVAPFLVSRFLNGDAQAATDAAEHVDEVERVLTGLEVEEVAAALDSVEILVKDDVIREWTPEERREVAGYADALLDKTRGIADVTVPTRPTVLGRPHVPAEAHGGAAQVCSLCESVLVPGGDDPSYYPVTRLIGVDCPGKVQAEGHRYPKGGKKKTAKGRKK